MKKVAVLLANGFEEIEAMCLIDILRRAQIQVLMAGLDSQSITGAHDVQIQTDILVDDLNVDELDMVLLPGGLPGAEFLAESLKVQKLLQAMDSKSKLIGAICAAPWALQSAGVLKNSYTCYPSFEKTIGEQGYMADKNVVISQNTMTSRGPATAMEFALEIVKQLVGEKTYLEVKQGLLA